jgi:DNA-binding IclR family transcriptional regulator
MAGVQSVERAFGILRALSLGPAGVTDLSERTGLPKSTVSRLLSALEEQRAVDQNDDGAYGLGSGIAELGTALRGGQSVVDVARPHMIELMELTGEAVGVNRFEGDQIRTLFQVDDPESSVVVRDWTGEATPAHAVPSGLAILANSSRAVQRNFLQNELEPLTDLTMTDPGMLLLRFEQIRSDGFAWVIDEFTEDISSVAASFADANGRIQFAVHIHGPSFRFPGDADPEELGNRVAATAQRIEAQLADD